MYTRGLGDASECGTNPCTWTDGLLPSQECAAYVGCVASGQFKDSVGSYIFSGGLLTPSQVAQVDASVVKAAGSEALDIGSDFAKNFAYGLGAGKPDTASNSLVTLGLVAGVALGGIFIARSIL